MYIDIIILPIQADPLIMILGAKFLNGNHLETRGAQCHNPQNQNTEPLKSRTQDKDVRGKNPLQNSSTQGPENGLDFCLGMFLILERAGRVGPRMRPVNVSIYDMFKT